MTWREKIYGPAADAKRQKDLELLIDKWYKTVRPAIEAAEQSEHLTAEDFAIRVRRDCT